MLPAYISGCDPGLSPQARGKPLQSVIIACAMGPIPAGTGETIPAYLGPELPWAYPRRHGGNIAPFGPCICAAGLSPQARGKPPDRDWLKLRIGPIPAGTGETESPSTTRPNPGAYPRRHGGNPENRDQIGIWWGLSPQARGKPRTSVIPSGIGGPIPAGTGETSNTVAYRMRPRAYPRRHGGNSMTAI